MAGYGTKGPPIGHGEQPSKTLVGERIRELRKARNWSARDLVVYSGVGDADGSQLSQYERGSRVPNTRNIAKLCEAFGISLSEFFRDIDVWDILCNTKDRPKKKRRRRKSC